MDKNKYELMKLTHIGKSQTALGFNANLKNSYATWGKDTKGNEWFEAWETKDEAISSYYYHVAEAQEEVNADQTFKDT